MEATIQDLLDAGAHFGHQSRYWNPKMKKYIYGTYNHINIINLEETLIGLRRACEFVHDLARNRKKLLLVGTKTAAGDIIKQEAIGIGQYYVNHRWMGGTLTNYNIICASINKLTTFQKQQETGMFEQITKKEAMMRTRAMNKLERNIGGIKDMNGLPDALFVVDVRYEHIAVAEGNKLGIPVMGIVDTNSNPDNIDYIIPGNDDSIRSITLFINAITSAFTEGEQLAEQYSMMRSPSKNKEEKKPEPTGISGKLSRNSADAENAQATQAIDSKAADSQTDSKAEVAEQQPAPDTTKPTNESENAAKDSNSGDAISAEIPAAKVKELREISGAGIMECKNALKESQGDVAKAADLLRESGVAKQLKRAARDAKEGVVAVKSEASSKAISVEINCETDFVARNEEFVDFAARVVENLYDNEPQLTDDVPQLTPKLEEELSQISQKMGEKIVIGKYTVMMPEKGGTVGAYVHNNHKLCALVSIDQDNPTLARDLAMQVAAMNPAAVRPEDVPQELIDKEKEIFLAQIKDEDKPDDIKEKMVAGKLKKFSAEMSLSEQSFIKNPDQKIDTLLKESEVKEVKFIRHALGNS